MYMLKTLQVNTGSLELCLDGSKGNWVQSLPLAGSGQKLMIATKVVTGIIGFGPRDLG